MCTCPRQGESNSGHFLYLTEFGDQRDEEEPGRDQAKICWHYLQVWSRPLPDTKGEIALHGKSWSKQLCVFYGGVSLHTQGKLKKDFERERERAAAAD